jgi:hypothetical protein|tara:strand:+ start:38 stop:409 length:372 start_codon:yes stop_codon:yes gene_type:complete
MATKRATKKTLTVHSIETKLEAVKQVNTLMAAGVTRYSACGQLAHEYDVKTQTILNWHDKHNTLLTRADRNNGRFEAIDVPTSFRREDGKFSIHSLSVRTVNGAVVRLTPTDIKGIAEYATRL